MTDTIQRFGRRAKLEHARLGAPPAARTRRETAATLLAAPIRGALFAMFLPLAGFAVLSHHLIAKARRRPRA